jgi:hypothetical protein
MKRTTRARQRAQQPPKRLTMILMVGLVMLLLFGGWYSFTIWEGGAEAAHEHSEGALAVDHIHGQEVELPHIHGMGYTSDGNQLLVAAHEGLRIYTDGEWLIPDAPAHDYMGFSPFDQGFYSSGHPAPRSGLRNPLGLVKSTDGGKTLTRLGFEGESDFHLMGAGYENRAIYVLNPAPNSRLEVGLYYTLDEGVNWQQSDLVGLTAQPIQLVVHPTQPDIVALATEAGLLLSTDFGNIFAPVGEHELITTVVFGPGDMLYFGYRSLYAYDLMTRQIATLTAPQLTENDGIAYLAVNPAEPDEIALATFERNIYLLEDPDQPWRQIVQSGKGL